MWGREQPVSEGLAPGPNNGSPRAPEGMRWTKPAVVSPMCPLFRRPLSAMNRPAFFSRLTLHSLCRARLWSSTRVKYLAALLFLQFECTVECTVSARLVTARFQRDRQDEPAVGAQGIPVDGQLCLH